MGLRQHLVKPTAGAATPQKPAEAWREAPNLPRAEPGRKPETRPHGAGFGQSFRLLPGLAAHEMTFPERPQQAPAVVLSAQSE